MASIFLLAAQSLSSIKGVVQGRRFDQMQSEVTRCFLLFEARLLLSWSASPSNDNRPLSVASILSGKMMYFSPLCKLYTKVKHNVDRRKRKPNKHPVPG
jgi:hypothetical protein